VHDNSLLLFKRYALDYFAPERDVLEIGPDGFPSTYRQVAPERAGAWDTLDLAGGPELTYQAAGEYEFPVEDDRYDIVFSAQVLEHVPLVWIWMREVARVCKPGGIVITINPVSWPFHKSPRDCWRVYPDGMSALYDDSSLEVVLSRWESLETPGYRRYIPGRSHWFQPRLQQRLGPVLGRLGLPVERAYDTITIGRKLPRRQASA
jgi:SAM-dependent methyltransferase